MRVSPCLLVTAKSDSVESMTRRPRSHTRFSSFSELHDYILDQGLALPEAHEVARDELARAIERRDSLKVHGGRAVLETAAVEYHWDLEDIVHAMEGHGIPPIAAPRTRRLIAGLFGSWANSHHETPVSRPRARHKRALCLNRRRFSFGNADPAPPSDRFGSRSFLRCR